MDKTTSSFSFTDQYSSIVDAARFFAVDSSIFSRLVGSLERIVWSGERTGELGRECAGVDAVEVISFFDSLGLPWSS